MTATTTKAPPHVPRWLVRTIWTTHRTLYRATGGRFGLRPANAAQWGMLRLHTIGRQTGKERIAIVGFIEDGAEPGDAGDERLGRPGARVVAQPAGQSRGHR